jgi:hypothetical protein
MMIPSRRKLGAAALIIAGISAFMVPFLLHSPSTQGTSSNNGGTNPNNGSHTTTPTTTTPTPTTTNPGTKDDGKKNGGPEGTPDTGACSDENASHSEATDSSTDLSVSHNAKDASDRLKTNHGHAYGLLKNQLDSTVALVKSMGTHNAAFHSHHDTKTDNNTVHTEQASSESSNDHDSSCAEKEETNDD